MRRREDEMTIKEPFSDTPLAHHPHGRTRSAPPWVPAGG